MWIDGLAISSSLTMFKGTLNFIIRIYVIAIASYIYSYTHTVCNYVAFNNLQLYYTHELAMYLLPGSGAKIAHTSPQFWQNVLFHLGNVCPYFSPHQQF